MLLPRNFRLSRDPDILLREVDAAIKIRDIKTFQRCRERIEIQWWESGFVLLLFISGLGFIITIFKLIPSNNPPLFWFVFFWFALFTISMIACLEFLWAKINALRQLFEINSRMLERLEKEIAGIAQDRISGGHPGPHAEQ